MYEIFKEYILYYYVYVVVSIVLMKNMIYLENFVICFCV